WFQRARRSPRNSRYREFYVWSDDPHKYSQTRIIFKDFESSNWSWDPVAGQYYWHRFYHHQPDLNYDSIDVRRAMLSVLNFWLSMGVDGLRLDAVPYLYEREGTNNENLPETHHFLRVIRQYVDRKFPNRMLLAEANQWPEDAVAYFGMGDECHMAFHFPLMPRIFMAVRMEDRFPIIDILKQTPVIPDTCQWALFLRNHDELTLEMVTDEERDYMYRVYSPDPQARINLGIRRRLAPLLGNNRRKIELLNGILFSLPGTPIIYYGDEIGMGDNIYLGDRNGVRTPMQWSGDRNAGFSRANPQKLYLPVIIDPAYHYEAVNVETLEANPHSLLWWMRRLIALRKRYPVFGRGSMELLYPPNRKILAFVRHGEDQKVLVVANLSRFIQPVELNLRAFKGASLKEIFGQTVFPSIDDAPYFMTLAPHSFYWFEIVPQRVELPIREISKERELPKVYIGGIEENLFLNGKVQEHLQQVLSQWLSQNRWFAGKSRAIQRVQIFDAVPLEQDGIIFYLMVLEVQYTEGEPELYSLPVRILSDEEKISPHQGICRLIGDEHSRLGGIMVEATEDPSFGTALIECIRRRHLFRSSKGEIFGSKSNLLKRHPLLLRRGSDAPIPLKVEQSNTSLNIGDQAVLKLYRKLDWGLNPEIELTHYLTEISYYPHIPHLLGYITYEKPHQGEMSLGVLLEFLPNEGDAARMSVDFLEHFFDNLIAEKPPAPLIEVPETLLGLTDPRKEEEGSESHPYLRYFVEYLHLAKRIGERTAELHITLASAPDDPNFYPEPISELYVRSIVHGMLATLNQTLLALKGNISEIPLSLRRMVEKVLDYEETLEKKLTRLRRMSLTDAIRSRIHGDYHLGQLLCRGDDFVIIDFEGEPMKTVSARRVKRSPLKDVAGMIRSFHYVWEIALERFASRQQPLKSEEMSYFTTWAKSWELWATVSFLTQYRKHSQNLPIFPKDETAAEAFLEALLIERALYEIQYELHNRPQWLGVPLRGLLSLLRAPED
ncbi:MAG: maltose alpha-D-glucosyltransferase, partial [bacterium]